MLRDSYNTCKVKVCFSICFTIKQYIYPRIIKVKSTNLMSASDQAVKQAVAILSLTFLQVVRIVYNIRLLLRKNSFSLVRRGGRRKMCQISNCQCCSFAAECHNCSQIFCSVQGIFPLLIAWGKHMLINKSFF